LVAVSAPVALLLVDDDDSVRSGLKSVLEAYGFRVTAESNARDALRRIATESFNVLLSDLHMPGAGDGLSLASAMRHANANAVTVIFSAEPDLTQAAAAILGHADEVLMKPMAASEIVRTIRGLLANGHAAPRGIAWESIASILERETESIIQAWFAQVTMEEELTAVTLTEAERCEHLSHELRGVVERLRSPRPLGSRGGSSADALRHGAGRRRQGYTAAMMAEETRILQASVFRTLQNNLGRIDLLVLTSSLMTIADELDSQLSQGLTSHGTEPA
jgi:DNA-binding response OmpR family regulator